MVRTVVLVLAAAAAGFLGGYLARGRGAAPTVREARPEPLPDVAARSRRPADDLAGALEALPTPERPRGGGRIDGTVRTEGGEPLAGAVVRAVLEVTTARGLAGSNEPRSLEDKVRAFVRWTRRYEANTFETTCGADGAFALTDLADGTYDVSGRASGYELTTETDTVRPGASVAFVARAVEALEVEARMPDGAPAVRAIVTARPEGGGEELEGWTISGRASMRLAPGTYLLQARQDGSLRSAAVPVVVTRGGPHPLVRLQLEPAPGLNGRVTFEEGTPTGTVYVRALRLGADDEPDPYRLVEEGETSWIFADDDTYEFDDDEIGPGRFLVGVMLNQTVVATRVVHVGAGANQCDFVIQALPPDQFVRVEVVGPGGTDVGSVEILSGAELAGHPVTDEDSAVRLRDRGFLVAHFPAGRDDRLFIEAVSERYGRARAYYERGRTDALQIAFAEPGRLVVEMRGYGGSGHEGFLRAALVRSGAGAKEIEELGEEATAFDETGAVALGPAGAGPHLLVVYVQIGDEYFEAARRDVRLRAGESRLAIPLPELHRLVVHAPRLDEGTVLELEPEKTQTWLSVKRRVGPDGRATFERLPPGRYELAPEEDFESEMRVTVPHAGELRFAPKAIVYNAMRVAVADPNGLIAQAGLQDGDLVVGVDGVEFADQRAMQLAMIKAAARKGGSALVVERNGRTIEVTVDLHALIGAGSAAGGGLAPTSR